MKWFPVFLFAVGSLLSGADVEVLEEEPEVVTEGGEFWFGADGEVVREVRESEKSNDAWIPQWVLRERADAADSGGRSRRFYSRSRGSSYPAWFYGYPSYGRGFYGGGFYGNPVYGGAYHYTPLPRARFQAGYRRGGFSIFLNR